MILNKDRINIYTIDSFINQIFKKAVAPYLDIYQYEIMEDSENEDVIAEVFKRILDNSDDFKLMERFLWENTERDIDKYIDLIAKVLNNRWKFLMMDYEPRRERKISSLTAPLDQCLNILESIAEDRGKELNENFFVKDFKDLMSKYQQLDSLEDKKKLIKKNSNSFFADTFWNGGKMRAKAVADLKESLEVSYEEFRQNLAGYVFNQEIIPYEKQIYLFSQRIFEIYDEIKFKQKSFTHTDISNYTYKYFFKEELDLLEGSKVSEYFFDLIGTQVNSLFIDEFQDTSILQWKILNPLIDSCENVIAVGDEKQSIYGWRGGEKELFANLEYILDGQSETLDICYRSHAKIIDFINRFFGNVEDNWEYNAVRNLPDKDRGYVEIMVGGEKAKINTDTKSFNKKDEEEQKHLEQLNKDICGDLKKEIAVAINNRIEDYSDVGILARSNHDLSEIADELDKKGIPYILESQDSLLEHDAVKPLSFLLSYIYYNDYFQLIQFLRSDLVGVNNSALKYLLTNKAKVVDYMAGDKSNLKHDDICQILDEVKSLRGLNYRQLTDYLVEQTGILNLFEDNSGALKNLYYFHEIMREFESLVELMAYIEDNWDSNKLKQVGVKEAEAVKLMTIHKAKGLSFDTEFFYWKPSSSSGNNNVLETYIEFDDQYNEVEDYLLTNTCYRKIFEYLDIGFAEKAERKQLMEEINNVYVALTRPKNNLFFLIESPRQLKDDKEGKYWSGSSYHFYEDAILAGAEELYLDQLVEAKTFGTLMNDTSETDNSIIEIPNLAAYFAAEKLSEETLFEYNQNKDFNLKLEGDLKRIAGLAAHYCLEHIKYNKSEERQFARDMVLARYGNILGSVKIEQILTRVDNFIKENLQYFNEDREVFTEYKLVDGDDTYRLDRLMVDEEKLEIKIIDYKTGALKEQAQLESYEDIIRNKVGEQYQISSEFVEV
jgi:ATP-dependent exoDNAse (exonuclease V) beta subunit